MSATPFNGRRRKESGVFEAISCDLEYRARTNYTSNPLLERFERIYLGPVHSLTMSGGHLWLDRSKRQNMTIEMPRLDRHDR